MKDFLVSFFTTIVVIAVVGMCYHWTSSKNIVEEDPGVEVYEPMLTPEQNAENMVEFQQQLIDQNYVDSVYITIPIEILSKIALEYPDLTQDGIVDEYLKNLQYYKTWLYQENTLNKVLKKRKCPEPDSIPKKATPDKML